MDAARPIYAVRPAYLDALRADLARLRATVARMEAISTRLASQRRIALGEIDRIDEQLAAVGVGR